MTRSFRADTVSERVLVSVIIPVYNAVPDLFERCLESVAEQTHGALEVIVVNDGSTADVAHWLAAATSREARARLLHQSNQGVSAARNAGIALATGDYICFVDADDYVEPDFIESALHIARRARADIVFGGIQVEHQIGSVQWRTGDAPSDRPVLYSSAEVDAVRAEVLVASPTPHRPTGLTCVTNVVAALYASHLAKMTTFREGISQAEDRLFNVDVLAKATTVAFSSESWYHYDQTTSRSATRSVSWKTGESIVATIEEYLSVGGYRSTSAGVADGTQVSSLNAAAARGIFNYLKMLVGVLAVVSTANSSKSLLDRVLTMEGMQNAMQIVRPEKVVDRVFLWCLLRHRTGSLLLLGRIWTATSASAPAKDNPNDDTDTA